MVYPVIAGALASSVANAQFLSSAPVSLSPVETASHSLMTWGNVSADGITNLVVGTNGTIFATSLEGSLHEGARPFLYALDGQDGTVKWSLNGTDCTGGCYSSYQTSVPALGADGTVVATFTVNFHRYSHGHRHIVYAVNGIDGSLKWSHDLGTHETPDPDLDGHYLSPPDADTSPRIGADGTVYVGCDTHVYVLDGEDGTLKDVLNFTDYGNVSMDYVTSSPALGADGAIFVGTGPHLVGTGLNQWTFACGNADAKDAGSYPLSSDSCQGTNCCTYNGYSTTGCPYPWGSSSPALGDNGTVYVSSFEGFTCAVDGTDGSLKWRERLSDDDLTEYWRLRPTLGANGVVYAPLAASLNALNAEDGSLKWRSNFGDGQRIQISPVVDVNGNLIVTLGPDAQGRQAFGSVLYLLNAENGSVLWRYDGDVVGSPVVDADGSYILFSDGQSIHRFALPVGPATTI